MKKAIKTDGFAKEKSEQIKAARITRTTGYYPEFGVNFDYQGAYVCYFPGFFSP